MNIDDINKNQEPIKEQESSESQKSVDHTMAQNPLTDASESQPVIPPVSPAMTVPPTPVPPPSAYSPWQRNQLNLDKIQEGVEKIKNELRKVIVGQEEMMDLMLAALFTSGHVLVEGVPGIAKTLLSKLMAKTLDTGFSRIQFTPDLMPTDVIGTTVYNLKTSEFSFSKGPVFSNIILIDEINRAPAKTQSALFEVMEEFQITMDGITYPMEFPFFVIATQNPIEQEGTYKLPEAQLDRFLFKINMQYPKLEEEKIILRNFRSDFKIKAKDDVNPVFSPAELLECQELIEKVYIKDELLDYIAAIIHNTRNNGDLFLGASPRASLAIMKTSKAIAAMNGRDFVTPDDIQYIAYPVLNHRIILTPEREMEGYDAKDVINDIIKKIEV
ncbi:MAG: MoxR-like ATPase, partial [Saprospiraceae bacterium]